MIRIEYVECRSVHSKILILAWYSGHDTPDPVSSVNATLLDAEVENGRMTAMIQWHQGLGHNFSRIDIADTKQAWIWAVGPTNKHVEDSSSVGAEIEQHSHYGWRTPCYRHRKFTEDLQVSSSST